MGRDQPLKGLLGDAAAIGPTPVVIVFGEFGSRSNDTALLNGR